MATPPHSTWQCAASTMRNMFFGYDKPPRRPEGGGNQWTMVHAHEGEQLMRASVAVGLTTSLPPLGDFETFLHRRCVTGANKFLVTSRAGRPSRTGEVANYAVVVVLVCERNTGKMMEPGDTCAASPGLAGGRIGKLRPTALVASVQGCDTDQPWKVSGPLLYHRTIAGPHAYLNLDFEISLASALQNFKVNVSQP